MMLYFTVLPERVCAVKYPAAESGTALVSKGEEIELQKEGETYVLPAARKEFLYQIQAEWKNGQVEYGFLVK